MQQMYIKKIYLTIFFTVANKCGNFIIFKISFLENEISRISENFILYDFCFFVPNYFLPGYGASETSTHHNRTCSFDIRLTTAITSFKFNRSNPFDTFGIISRDSQRWSFRATMIPMFIDRNGMQKDEKAEVNRKEDWKSFPVFQFPFLLRRIMSNLEK